MRFFFSFLRGKKKKKKVYLFIYLFIDMMCLDNECLIWFQKKYKGKKYLKKMIFLFDFTMKNKKNKLNITKIN